MIGRDYLLRGQLVTVLARWAPPRPCRAGSVTWHRPPKRTAPRNVLIESADGSLTVRPFRGLRRPNGDHMPSTPPPSHASDSTPQPAKRPGGAGPARGNSFSNGFSGPPENVSRGLYGEAKGQWEGVA